MATPPAMDTFVVLLPLFLLFGPGVDDLEAGVDFDFDLGNPRSDTSVPAAEGGGREDG